MLKNFLSGIFNEVFAAIHVFVTSFAPDPNVSFGITIILFTIVAKVCLLPLSIQQTKSTAKMSAVQPELKKLQDKYKNDPQRQQQEMAKLYKEHNISPLGGCLPMLIQWPIIIALFYVFQNFDYQGAGFLWMADLTKPDPFYILPIVSGLTTYISMLIMQPDSKDLKSQTGMMNIGMAIFMGFMSLKFPSALVIYWTVSNLFQMAQSYFLNKKYKKKAAAK